MRERKSSFGYNKTARPNDLWNELPGISSPHLTLFATNSPLDKRALLLDPYPNVEFAINFIYFLFHFTHDYHAKRRSILSCRSQENGRKKKNRYDVKRSARCYINSPLLFLSRRGMKRGRGYWIEKRRNAVFSFSTSYPSGDWTTWRGNNAETIASIAGVTVRLSELW